MSTALAVSTDQWTREQVDLIKATVARNTTDAELKLFLYTAHRNGLDPLIKEIWCIVRPEKRRNDGSLVPRQLQIMTSHQGYINAARRNYTGEYRTTRSFAVCAKDDFEFDAMSSEVRKHVVKADRGPVIGAWAIAENAKDERIGVYLNMLEMKEACSSNPLWGSRPTQMILKTAEVHVLRRMFPVTGIYTMEEMDGDLRAPEAAPQRPAPAPKPEPSQSGPVEPDEIEHRGEKIATDTLTDSKDTNAALEQRLKDQGSIPANGGASDDRPITEPQRKRMWAIAKDNAWPDEAFRDVVKGYGYESTKDVKKRDYEPIVAVFSVTYGVPPEQEKEAATA